MLKRLWDTENKKAVRAVNKDTNKEYQVWTNDDGSKLYIYDIEWKELSASLDVCEYGAVWKELDDETVGYYLTNKPTDLYNWDEGEEVAYAFKNGSTTLQSGKIDEGETPEYTGDTPTKPDDEEYSYTFSGWKPTVGPIYKKTDFKAQFTATPLPTLLTYSELVALGTGEAILAELNTNNEGYYASLTAEGHIYEQSPQEGTTVAVIAEVVGEDQQSSTPLLVDGGLFMYMVEGTPGEGLSLHTWYTMPVGN